MNAGNALFIDVIPDDSGGFLVNAGADLLVAPLDVRRLLLDPGGVFSQDFPNVRAISGISALDCFSS